MTPAPVQRPLLIVVSAPSGAGKSTLCERLLGEFGASMAYSISCTTRAPRAGEVDGTAYFFLSEAEFDRRLAAGDFLEHAQVHGHRYGTPRSRVEDQLAAGRDVLMDIDVQGARAIRQFVAREPASALARAHVDLFVAPPSAEVLRTRLEGRGTDAPAVIERRLHNAGRELACWREYAYLVVNDRLDDAYDRLRAIVRAEHCRILPPAP